MMMATKNKKKRKKSWTKGNVSGLKTGIHGIHGSASSSISSSSSSSSKTHPTKTGVHGLSSPKKKKRKNIRLKSKEDASEKLISATSGGKGDVTSQFFRAATKSAVMKAYETSRALRRYVSAMKGEYFIRYPGSLQRRRLRRQQRWKMYAVAKKSLKKLMRKTCNNYYAPYFSETTTTASPKQSNKAMGKKNVGGFHFHVGASTARHSRQKHGYRRAFRLFPFVWLFIGCCLVSVCEVRGSSLVPNGCATNWDSRNCASGLNQLVDVYLAGSGTAYDNVVSTYGHIQNWDTSQVTNMRYLFYNMNSGNPDISKWNTGAVTDMSQSKSFTIECCVVCLCQLMLFVGCCCC